MVFHQTFCREESLGRDEPLFGTASVVRRWILVERNGAWGSRALYDNRFGAQVSKRLRALAQANSARMLLVRRHGRYDQVGIRVLVAYSGRERQWIEELFFVDPAALLAHDFSPLREGEPTGGSLLEGHRYFVCTHGKHDPCCARHGRLVAHALAQEFPDATWETSHIGGDRFAANVLILPLGVYYGRVEALHAARLMRRLSDGQLDLAHYRGRSSSPFEAQAAEWLARERVLCFGVDDVRLLSFEKSQGTVSRSRFRLRDGRIVSVEIETTTSPAVRLTCHARHEDGPAQHRLRELRFDS